MTKMQRNMNKGNACNSRNTIDRINSRHRGGNTKRIYINNGSIAGNIRDNFNTINKRDIVFSSLPVKTVMTSRPETNLRQ